MSAFVLLLAGSIFAAPVPSPSSAQARLSCEWSHSIAVTATAGGAAHNEEIRVDLTAADFPAGYTMSADGDDLRVFASDNTTAIPFFISRWDAFAQEAVIFIRPPAIGAGSSATYNFFLGNGLIANASDANSVFPSTGIRVLSRVSAADPTSAAQGLAELQAASSTIADVVRPDVFRINNRTFGGTTGDYGFCVSTMLNVSPAQAGTWDFRGGFDFGRGGHFRVDEVDLEGDWNDDLWWALNFANADVLQGSRTLAAGWHRLEALGFEGCCDGPIEVQARPPGGSYTDLRTSNFTLRSAICTNITVTTSTVGEACPIGLDVTKNSAQFLDEFSTDFALPGATVTYEIGVSNTGQRVDAATIDILDTLPPETRLVVVGVNAFELIDGTPASGLSLNWGGVGDGSDGVEFSIDGTNFGYTPVPLPDGTDPNITHVRFLPTGSLNPATDPDEPNFTVRLQLVIE
ncbi:MAG: CCXG family PEP-CTERM protein [Erythrobacter sp.]